MGAAPVCVPVEACQRLERDASWSSRLFLCGGDSGTRHARPKIKTQHHSSRSALRDLCLQFETVAAGGRPENVRGSGCSRSCQIHLEPMGIRKALPQRRDARRACGLPGSQAVRAATRHGWRLSRPHSQYVNNRCLKEINEGLRINARE